MASHLQNLSEYDAGRIPDVGGARFAIIVSEWNTSITHALAEGALSTLMKHGIPPENVMLHHVPGSFELPQAANMILNKNMADAVICLGCVIQGETRHFDFICIAAAQGIMDASIAHGKPVVFGVLTTENQQQAIDRSGGKHGNKGVEAAITAIKMIALQNMLS